MQCGTGSGPFRENADDLAGFHGLMDKVGIGELYALSPDQKFEQGLGSVATTAGLIGKSVTSLCLVKGHEC